MNVIGSYFCLSSPSIPRHVRCNMLWPLVFLKQFSFKFIFLFTLRALSFSNNHPFFLTHNLSLSLSLLIILKLKPFSHLLVISFATMVGTRQGTNTSGKDKKMTKKAKKSSTKDKHMATMHGVKIKRMVHEGKVDGPDTSPLTVEPSN